MTRIHSALVFLFVLSAGEVFAQRLTVQQPVFERFSVGTTVSVPDRGRALLGSVSRAGESRKSFGPFRSGTNTGLFRDHSSASTHVTIHDLRAMDELLLQQTVRSAGIPRGPALGGNAGHAYRSLISRHQTGSASVRRETTLPPTTSSSATATTGDPDEAERFYALGLRAENRGRHSLAKLHFRAAAQHGSREAKARLTGSLVAKP